MSSVYIPDWAAQEELARWGKKFPVGLVRVLVQDKLSVRSSHTKVRMYRAWLEAHPYTDEERADMARFLGLDVPTIQLVEVNGPMGVVHHFTEVEEEEDPDLEQRTIEWLKDRFPEPPGWKSRKVEEDHPGLGEVEYVVNKRDYELVQEIVDEAPCFTLDQIKRAIDRTPEQLHYCVGDISADELIEELMRGENHHDR